MSAVVRTPFRVDLSADELELVELAAACAHIEPMRVMRRAAVQAALRQVLDALPELQGELRERALAYLDNEEGFHELSWTGWRPDGWDEERAS